MPTDSGNAVGNAGHTGTLTVNQEQPGQPEAQTDLTDVVSGLSRQITSLKKQLVEQVSKPDEDTAKKVERLERENAKYKTILQYPDVAPVLSKLMDKPTFDPSVIDDDFISAIRAAKSPNEPEEIGTAHNPPRQGGRLNQDQQDEQNVKSLQSIFDIV